MKNKKATENIMLEILMGAVVGLIAVIIFIGIGKVYSSVFLSQQNVDCTNSKFWDSARGLRDVLKDVDSKGYGEFTFYNNNCNLVSFTSTQENKIKYQYSIPNQPLLCLCSIDDETCQPYACYKFKNFNRINAEQFTTQNLKSYVFLKFIKDGKTLRINYLGDEKPIEPLEYNKPKTQTKLDQEGLIYYMLVVFKNKDIKGFTPIIKTRNFLVPEGVNNIEGFTKIFDIELAEPSQYEVIEEDFLEKHESISPDLVKIAVLTLSISKEKYNSLSEEQKNKINLYYRSGTEWRNSSMYCSEQENEVLCNTVIREFSNNFAISTIETKQKT
ncbi:hypothetical protein HYU23_03610 [Candidatus Woesearchaeota archaeon]|nr:hypothetical protein [Candidatus Woesearchaeota archaeon]